MSDFISDLEAELLAAARRRAGSRRRVLLPRPRPATVLAVVALAALVVAGLAAVRGLGDGSRPADEQPSLPPGPGVVLALPAAEAARPCPGVQQRTQAGDAPQPFPLSVFERPQTEPDAMPSLTGADSYSWIPAGTIFPDGSRRPSPDQFDAELHLVPAAEPRQGGGCVGELQPELGVCLVVGAGDAVVKCFSDEDVEAGRALAVTSSGVVHGIAPDGVGRATLHFRGESIAAEVHENAYEIRAPVAAGDRVRLELERLEECRPSPELLDVVPALRDGTWQTLPGDATPAAGVRQWARRIEAGGELELWAVARCDGVERACVLGVHAGKQMEGPCGTADEIRTRGAISGMLPVGDGLVVMGLAPPRMRSAQAVRGDRVLDLTFANGVFGGLLPAAFAQGGAPLPSVQMQG
jgi:hypothetical protein